ncbi:MAG TPA: LptF/LptG family permease [Phycisphaerae bacterium]|nr:LptF/LptG family permease [Phycisphaerales bacterium]HRX83456.1 LptF/LptG family permease [Phycisphaerae bacterium]
MLWTLQTYISRELGKTFALTSVGLVAVIGLGGGVMNMIGLEGVSTLQLLKLIGLIIPVAATLTLPIAALYSATVTYGRLSADNELTACRSGGINIHVLFVPTLVISAVSAGCCFIFISFVIPVMVRNLDRLFENDFPRLIKQQLSTSDRFSIRDKLVIYADNTELVKTEEGEPLLQLKGVAFSQNEDDAWVRFGTAQSVLITFGRQDGRPSVAANMYGIHMYDAARGGFFYHDDFPISAVIPKRLPIKIKWLTLGGLLQYLRHPATYPEVEEGLDQLRGGIARSLFFNALKKQFVAGFDEHPAYGEVRFGDAEASYTLRSGVCTPDRKDGRPRFSGDVVIYEEHADGTRRVVHADAAVVDVRRDQEVGDATVQVEASGHVAIEDSRQGKAVIRRERENLDPVLLPREIVQQAMAYSSERLLRDDGQPLGLGDWVQEHRKKAIAGVGMVSREITGEIHARLAFSISVFVLVILGAALGIVFRGSQVLVAFGISFVPSALVISTIIMGKQLIEKPGMTWVGIGVIWGGIVLVAIVDLFVLTKVVRR